MVKFFNQQEDVIDIQLTPYGKRKFSEGKFNPYYYGLYDTDILYDAQYADIATEQQNNIVRRIKEETPRLRVQANFTSSTSEVMAADLDGYQFQNITEANAQFFRFLGRNSPWSDYAPSWIINNLEDSVGFIGGYEFRSQLAVPVFTASLNIEYSSIVHEGNNNGEDITIDYTLEKNDRLLLDILELNTIFKGSANYEVEIFRRTPGQEDILIPLKFLANRSESEAVRAGSNSSLAGTDVLLGEEYPTLSPEDVEYFLSVKVDREIEGARPIRGSTLYKSDFDPEIAALCEEDGLPFEDV